MTDQFEIDVVLAASPETVYQMWLDSEGHAALVGGQAEVEPGVGGAFSIWDGYITGTTLEVDPGRRIVQAWRTTEFPEGAADSRLELRLEPVGKRVRLILIHSEIPEGQGKQYLEGWKEHYFTPMQAHFTKE